MSEPSEERQALCLCCGKPFRPYSSAHKFCSEKCRRKYDRTHDLPHPVPPFAPVLRSFHCRRCGALVEIRSTTDFRRVFCSSRCERLYWKHRRSAPKEADPDGRTTVL